MLRPNGLAPKKSFEIDEQRHLLRGISYFWYRIRNASFIKTLAVTISVIRHLRLLLPLLLSRPGSKLYNYLRARPEILEMVYGPYIAANWDARTKITRVVDHCETVAAIGGIIDFPPETVVDLIHLTSIGAEYRITLDQARWLLREGQLILSLWDGIDRIFHLGFSLSTQDGKRVAYIGGIQGRQQFPHEVDILNRYHLFTKAAFGSRPRDFLVEVFKIFCKSLNVTEICAVSDLNHPIRKIVPGVELSYNEIWRERGGIDNGDGFFILPINLTRRSEESIPAKKRAMYRKRYSMLADIEKELAARLRPMAADRDIKSSM